MLCSRATAAARFWKFDHEKVEMQRLILSFPECVRSPLSRRAIVGTVKSEGEPLALNVEQRESASDADMYRLLSVLSGQRRVVHVTLQGMTFTGFYAQMLVAFMSRYTTISVVFYACAFGDYVEYRTDCAQRSSSIELDNCKMTSANCDDFIASMACPLLSFRYTKVAACLGSYHVSGKTYQKK